MVTKDTPMLKDHTSPLVLIQERLAKLSQPCSQDEYDHAVSLIKNKLSYMSHLNAILSVELGTNYSELIIDARNGKVDMVESIANTREDEPNARVRIRPEQIQAFVSGDMEPRYAINWGYFKIDGEIRVGIKFMDAIGPYHPQHRKLIPGQVLPQPTTDIQQAKKDFADFGYSLVKDALSPEDVKLLYNRLMDQANAEKEAGVAQFDGQMPGVKATPNQRIWCLPNKGDEFISLLNNRVINEFVSDFTGNEDTILFTYTANIVREGNIPMILHYDQITMMILLSMALCYLVSGTDPNMIYIVTAGTGGTLIMPASHKKNVAPDDLTNTSDFISAEGPAGTCLVLDSRTWHTTGRNTIPGSERPVLILFFAKRSILEQESFHLSLRPNVFFEFHPDVESKLPPKVKEWIKWRREGSDGSSKIVGNLTVNRQQDPVGRMSMVPVSVST